MHPGPMVRGMEIASEVADSLRSTITEQVANGVSVRMAVLYLLLGRRRLRRRCRMSSVLIKGAAILGGSPSDVADRRREDRRCDRPEASAGASTGATCRSTARVWSLLPGLVDLHTHLREPGREDAETVQTGTRAAALGGFTAVHAMANTEPVADTAGVVEQVWRLGTAAAGHCDVAPGRRGHGRAGTASGWPSSARWPTARRAGSGVLRRRRLRLRPAADAPRPGIRQGVRRGDRPARQEPRLTEGCADARGRGSARLGLTGWPSVAEEAIIARDILLTGPRRLPAAHLPRLDGRLGRAHPGGQGTRGST